MDPPSRLVGTAVAAAQGFRAAQANRARLRSGRADDGVATVAACLALLGLVILAVLVGQVGVATVARHRAQAAADLAALAAAGAVADAEDGCAKARETAQRMRIRMRDCVVADPDVTVTVETEVSLGPIGARAVQASARAGPSDDGDDSVPTRGPPNVH